MAKHSNYVVGFYFQLSIAGQAEVAFQEVSGIGKEENLEEVVCGGENRFKYRLPKGTTYPNLILKRGILKGGNSLMKWVRETLNGGMDSPIIPKNLTVNVLDEKGKPCLSWHFVQAYPIKWSVSDLKSQENALLIENIELAYQYFENNPV